MPIYEFICPKNQRIYSFFARSISYADKVPKCPDNPKWKLERLLSNFAVTGRAKEPSAAPAGDMDDSKMEAAMEAMEREVGGVAESENPDPRALAAMMRRMGELTGEKMPPQMNEVIARLEKGEDPEKLEADYGDVFDAMDSAPEESPLGEMKRKLRRNPRVSRDPALYEMSDYL
jgi:hypothetical protein